MNRIKIDHLKELVFVFVRFLNLFVKREKEVVLCSGWQGMRFADNSRYMYLYLNDYKDFLNIKKVVWITVNKQINGELKKAGYNTCMKYSLKSVYYHLKAGVFYYDQFFSDFLRPLSGNAVRINLWHGLPIKKFGCYFEGVQWQLRKGYLFTCSPFGKQLLGKAFRISDSQAIYGMYPRNYYLLNDIPFLLKEEKIFLDILNQQKNKKKKILFYLPTFRKKTTPFLGEENQNVLSSFFDYLRDNDYFLISKLHFKDVIDHNADIKSKNECFINLPSTVDIYPFLKEADLLITDYSSVLFDFLYLRKKIVCYAFDLSYYKTEDQGFIFDYNILPVDIMYTLQELISYLEKENQLSDDKKDARDLWLQKCFANYTMDDSIYNILSIIK